MLSSLTKTTVKQYTSALKRCHSHCSEYNIDFFDPELRDFLHYLLNLFGEGASYGAINNHRSAISLVPFNKIGDHLLVSRFMKAIYKTKPSRPRYDSTWDISLVLRYIEKMRPAFELSLREITVKIILFLVITTAHSSDFFQN